MPKIKRNTHEIEIGKEEDIEIRGRRFRFYFQNRYTLISLAVDLLTGIFYIFGSLASLTKIPDRYGTYFYLAGAVFLTIRPILRIVRNIFIYDEKRTRKKHGKAVQPSPCFFVILVLCIFRILRFEKISKYRTIFRFPSLYTHVYAVSCIYSYSVIWYTRTGIPSLS